jgi:hypothetical protein
MKRWVVGDRTETQTMAGKIQERNRSDVCEGSCQCGCDGRAWKCHGLREKLGIMWIRHAGIESKEHQEIPGSSGTLNREWREGEQR